jgi:hypothetical protein
MVSYVHVVYVTCYFCNMFSLGPSSGSTGSVRIYRSVMRTSVMFGCIHLIYIGAYTHKYIGHESVNWWGS